ncbi:MAG TPA: hypothetical protein VEA15_05505 [Caulobacteraceae bacterium]|nr:hypothetical protein [Caulobacteraceae bacterium]
MTTNVERISSVAASLNQAIGDGGNAVSASPANRNSQQLDTGADYRLVIEQDGTTGGFVYKTLNRATGEVVNQFPREEVLRLRASPGYAAGQVIQTKA